MTAKKDPKDFEKTGRPTKYKKAYDAKIVEFMGKGKSLTQFAASISVCKDTVYQWLKVHPSFSDAFKLAKTKCEARWQDKLEDFMLDTKCNSPLIKLWFANMFGWSDKVETNTTVSLGDQLKNLADKLPD